MPPRRPQGTASTDNSTLASLPTLLRRERRAPRACGAGLLLLTVLLGLVLSPALVAAAITTSGVITNSQTWQGVVSLTGDVTVATNGNLTILPGTRVRCDARADDQVGGLNNSRIEILVQPGGVLTAVGTETTPILFTSWPLTPGQETNGDWYGLRLASTNATLQYCTIEYAIDGLTIEDGPPVVEHCVMRNNSNSGLSSSATVYGELSNCSLSNNVNYGAIVSSFRFVNCLINSNRYGIIGGGNSGLLVTSNCTIAFNSFHGLSGGGTIQCSTTTFNNNGYDNLNNGAGVYAYSATLTLKDCGAFNNVTGIKSDSGAVNVFNCSVSDNLGVGLSLHSSSGVISNSVMRNNLGAAVSFSEYYSISPSLIISDSVITGSPLGIDAGAATNSIMRNVIQGNTIGIQTTDSSSLITNNLIFGNATYDLKHQGSLALIADGNYWGEPTTTELANGVRNLTKIYDSRDQVGLGQVVIHTWDATPNGVLVAPSIAIQPQNLAALLGGGAAFSVLAGGSPPLFYQWTKDGAPVPHATNFSLALGTVTTNDFASYQVVITNSYGSATSAVVTLTQAVAASVPVLGAQLFAGLTIGGEVGRNYTIQYTFDLHPAVGLINWTALTTLVLPSSPFTYIDLTAPVDRPRFYRAFLSP